jgi:hypothetical protein
MMAKQEINLGTAPNARNGDSLRAAFNKVNANFNELYNYVGVTNLTELAQDYAAEMFLNGEHEGISVSYNDATNKFNLVVEQDLDGGAASTVFDDDNNLDGGGA